MGDSHVELHCSGVSHGGKVAVMAHDTLNQLTNLASRNIGWGLDPVLLTIEQPVLDQAH